MYRFFFLEMKLSRITKYIRKKGKVKTKTISKI